MTAGVGNRAERTMGTGNSGYKLWAKVPGTGGNAIGFTVAIGAADSAASVAVVGNAITFTAASVDGAVGTSTVNEMIRVVGESTAARALIHLTRAPGSDGTGVVTAVATTLLAGAVQVLRDGHAIAALVVIGLVQMAWHPVKTWDLVVNNKGWYDQRRRR